MADGETVGGGLHRQVVISSAEGSAAVSLADLLETDMTGIAEVRFTVLPVGVYIFAIKSAEIDTMPIEDKQDSSRTIERAFVQIVSTVIDCKAVADGTEQDQIDKEHRTAFFIAKEEDLGRLKAFLVDIGMTESGKLKELLLKLPGWRYKAAIKHVRNKRDPDRPYINLDKIETLEQTVATA